MVKGVKLISVDTLDGADVGDILFQAPEKVAKKMLDFVMSDRVKGGDFATYYFASMLCGRAEVEKVIFNDKTTIVFWNDHTKTVVKCQEGDTFSEEAGVALCFMKKMLGNKGNYNKVLHDVLEKAQRQGE